MAHFAEIDENNVVLRVIKVDNESILDENRDESEEVGVQYLKNLLGKNKNFKKCSYNTIHNTHKLGGTPYRKNYPGIGFIYDEARDAFYRTNPYPGSWTLDETRCVWVPPVPFPSDHSTSNNQTLHYQWDVDTNNWVETANTSPPPLP